eukprot:5972538-Prorocentrum_lima.AAC.1
MTSSLVGSEMCIRDSRVLCAHERVFREQWEDLHGSEHFARSYTASVLYTCLLYTSDAADDM